MSRIKFFTDKYDLIKKEANESGTKIDSYDNFIKSVLSKLNREKFEAGKFIYHKGDVGTKMYFVIDGEVNIYVPKTYDEQKVQAISIGSFLENFREVPPNQSIINFLDENLGRDAVEIIKKNITQLDNNIKIILESIKLFHRGLKDEIYLYFCDKEKKSIYYKNGVFLYKQISKVGSKGCLGEVS